MDDQVVMETFEMFALRHIALRRCIDEETAKPFWAAALSKPGSISITRNGRHTQVMTRRDHIPE